MGLCPICPIKGLVPGVIEMDKINYLWICFDVDFGLEFSSVTQTMPDDCKEAFIENGYLETIDCLGNPIGIKLEVY